MKSTIDLINKLYDEFIELKHRMIAMGNFIDSDTKDLTHVDTCGTDNIVISISTENIDSDRYELYLDIVELYKLGYDFIDTDKDFYRINVSTFFFNLEDESLSYFNRRLRYAIVKSDYLTLSLNNLLSIKFSKGIIHKINVLEYMLNNYNYSFVNHLSYKIYSSRKKLLDSDFDLKVVLYLSFNAFSENKFEFFTY